LPSTSSRQTAFTALFVATVACNAALLFAVEPMVSKRVLPLFGGAPSVWNTCLMAFQAMLLLGYLYAHLVAQRVGGGRRQAAVHLTLFALSLLALPPIVRHAAPPAGWPPTAWLLLLLLGAVGAPFVVLSAGAPLLQRWYAALPARGEPYFLYAASNAGSMLALLGYPIVVEPRVGLAAQAQGWAVAYAALGVGVAACALAASGAPAAAWVAPAAARAEDDAAGRARWIERLRWTFLALVPSALLLGVTRYVTTDVAPVPLLWVIPLALYLLTFVAAFAERARVPAAVLEPLSAALLPLLALLTALGVNRPLWAIAGAHVVAVGVASLVCHQTLADRRPAPARLTEFYLFVSLGGLAGGVFDAVVAPAVFDTLAEYPIAIALAGVAWAVAARLDDEARYRGPGGLPPHLQHGADAPSAPHHSNARPHHLFARLVEPAPDAERLDAIDRTLWYAAGPLAAGALMFAAVLVRMEVPSGVRGAMTTALGVPAALLAFALRRRPWAYALGLAALLAGASVGQRVRAGGVLLRARSFFGAYAVRETGTYHHLQNGTTLHGAQDTRPQWRTTPLTYYHAAGPLGTIFARVPALARDGRRVAVVGLGTGTLACYGRRGERWTFYEIDPLIVRIARDPRLFTYLRDCPPTTDVVVGDARLRLAEAPDATYDLLVLDAFSSDAIPTHLLTREAVALYLAKLRPGGILVVHVSNRYLNLVPVVAELARDARVAGSYGNDVSGESRRRPMISPSVWVVLAHRAAEIGAVTRLAGWAALPAGGDLRVWTDDFTDVLSVVKWR
jgi:SAM-dependent methyltransferase